MIGGFWGCALGFFSLLTAFALSPFRWDLFLTVFASLSAIAKWQMRGASYALIFLSIGGLFYHLFAAEGHLWALGLEASVALSLFTIALSFEESTAMATHLQSQLQNQEAAVHNLEDDLVKGREEATACHIAHEEKITQLAKELEEKSDELSALTLLNDVLRHTTARMTEEKQALEEENRALSSRLTLLQEELLLSQKSDTALSNRELLHELNTARVEREQTHLINEALVRFRAKEALKTKETEPMRTESPGISDAQEKLRALLRTEALYRQLREQFEEKDKVLHETRAELFHTHTELQALKIIKDQIEPPTDSLSAEIEREFAALEGEIESLRKENGDLLELISSLTAEGASSAKKKVRAPQGQGFLFEA